MSDLYKYPRTLHVNWSPGATSDDKFVSNLDTMFSNKRIIVTEKMDGENTNMYADHYHARSLDSKDHPSRHFVKGIWAGIKHEIPEGWRICGENVYAKHSIEYQDLETYFYVFSIWDEKNNALSWGDTVSYCDMLGLKTVPVLADMIFQAAYIKDFHNKLNLEKQEGYVIRTFDGFHYDNFTEHVAKWVRQNHVQTDQHWMQQQIIPNKLKKDSYGKNDF